MITRETKAGLVVSASFLCLVAVVVASKMRGTDGDEVAPPTEPTIASAAALPEEPKPSMEVPTMAVQPQVKPEEQVQPMPTGQAEPEMRPLTPTTPANSEPQIAMNTTEQPAPAPVSTPAPTNNTEAAPGTTAPSGPETISTPASTNSQPANTQPTTAPTETPQPILMPAPTETSAPVETRPEATPASTPTPAPISTPAPAETEIKQEPKKNEMTPPPRPAEYEVPPSTPTQPRVVGADGFSGVPTRTAEATQPEPKVNLLRPVSAETTQPGVAPTQPRVSPPVADDAPETQPLPRAIPPVGTPSTVGVPPIPVTMPSGNTSIPPIPTTPQVDSYDELTHRVKAGETLESIAKQHLTSENYAPALLAFNRAHPRCAAGLAATPPHLDEGTTVFVPPVRILDKNYASMIPGFTPVARPIPSAPAVQPIQPVTQPRPGVPTQPISAVPAPPTLNPNPVKPQPAPGNPQPAATGNEKLYRVRAGGEMFLEIAKHTLGTGDRWVQIYQLNTRFNPEYRIPAGTVLRLPVDARIDAADVAQ